MAISLVGDGIFLIAIAWEAYALWNAPAALSIVGIGMTVPDGRLPAGRRRPQRPARPPAADAVERSRARGGGRLSRGARVHGLAAALAPRRAGGASTAAARRSSRPRSRRSFPTCCRRRTFPPRTRSTSSCARSRFGCSGRCSAACWWRRAPGSRSPWTRLRSALRRSRCSCCARVQLRVPSTCRTARRCARGSTSSAAASGCGARSSPRPPRTSSSSARARSCSRTWSRTSCTPRRGTSASSSRRAEPARSAPRS